MSELERRIGAAFDAAARASVSDSAAPPPPRFAGQPAGRRRGRWLAPLAAAAAVVAVGASVLALRSGGQDRAEPAAAATPVRIQLATASGQTYGVGMPVVAYFSHRFGSATSLSASTAVTVNGKPAAAAWYFEASTERPGYPIEGHLRLRGFWPANSSIRVRIAAQDVSAGAGSTFANAAEVSFRTGPRTVAVVDDQKHVLSLTRDGKWLGSYRVALGAPATPTSSGIKVIMQKAPSVCLTGPGYHECGVKYAQRLTYSGEYLHAAPWNAAAIKLGQDNSNGCTNLLPADAATLYKVLTVGDVVEYPDATGPPMRPGAGLGDWNVPWAVWRRGGLIPTS